LGHCHDFGCRHFSFDFEHEAHEHLAFGAASKNCQGFGIAPLSSARRIGKLALNAVEAITTPSKATRQTRRLMI